MKINRFEDLQCWQEARILVKMVYKAINNNHKMKSDFRFAGQFSAAAVSTMSNIAEGFAKKTDKEFSRGLWISKGSAAEVQSLTYAAIDLNYITKKDQKIIYEQAEKVSKLDSGMIKYLYKSNIKPQSKLNDSRTQVHNDTMTQRPKDSKTQRPKDPRTQ